MHEGFFSQTIQLFHRLPDDSARMGYCGCMPLEDALSFGICIYERMEWF